MPPENKPKIKVKITSRFVDEQGGQLFGPGEWDVDPAVSMRLVANGRATLVGKGKAVPAPTKQPPKPPPSNPRIPPANTEGEADDGAGTPLPEGFPSQGTLAVAGFTTVESLRVPDVKEKLGAVEGLTPADITKIGLAISKA